MFSHYRGYSEDLRLLSQFFLLGDLQVFIKKTDYLWGIRKEKILKQIKKDKELRLEKKINFGIGFAITLGLISAGFVIKRILSQK